MDKAGKIGLGLLAAAAGTFLVAASKSNAQGAPGSDIEVILANYGAPGNPWPRWVLQVYSGNDLGKMLLPPVGDFGVTQSLDAAIEYDIPPDWTWPLRMALIYQNSPGVIENGPQSLSVYHEQAGWGTYIPNFVLPSPGKYVIDAISLEVARL